MSTLPARQPKGIPVGGQFAATVHAEPGLTLAPAATTPVDQQQRLEAIRAKRDAIEKLQNEMDLLNLDAAVASVRRHFPDAAELYVDNARHGWTGEPLDEFAPKSLRDKDGNDITPDDRHWFYRRPEGDDNIDPGVSIHLSRLGRSFFGYPHDGIRYDSATGHRVIDLTQTYSAEAFPAGPSLGHE